MVRKFIKPSSFKKLIRASIVCGALVLTTMSATAQNDNANPNATGANWKSNGNAATASDFIGTTNAQDLIFKTNNEERLLLDQTGNLILKDRINPGNGGGGEVIISPGLLHRAIPTNPIAAYMLKVGGSGIFEGELNAKQLFVEEYITFMKSLKGPRIDVDSVKMDSTRGIYGQTKIVGDLTIKQKLTVDGDALFRSKLTAEQGIIFDGTKGLRKTTTAGGNAVYKLGDPISTDPVVSCEFPAQSEWFYFGGKIQLYDEGSNTSLTMGSDGYQSVIESAGNNKLLLNWYCGKDVSLCTGANATSSNGRGGVVHMGHNVMIGGPLPANNYNIALNINGDEQTGLFVKSVSTTNPNNYGVVSSVNGLNNKAYVVLLQNGSNDKEVINLRGNGEALFGTNNPTTKPTLYVSPSVNASNQFVTGKVGIGTDAPTTALTIKGDVTISDMAVGITRTLLVDGTGKLVAGTASSTSATAWNLGGNDVTTSIQKFIGTTSQHPFDIWAGGTKQLSIRNDGKTVLGTSNLALADYAKLNVTDIAPTGIEVFADGVTSGLANKSQIRLQNAYGWLDLAQDENGIGRLKWASSNTMSFKGESILIGEPASATDFGDINTKFTISTKTANGYTSFPLKIINPDLSTANKTIFKVQADGKTCINCDNPGTFMLAVNGKLGAREIKVTMIDPWPDYVFEKNYTLLPLREVEKFITTNKHLPEVPSQKQIMEEDFGLDIAKMQALQMKKTEEIFLYLIQMQKQIDELKKENEVLKIQTK